MEDKATTSNKKGNDDKNQSPESSKQLEEKPGAETSTAICGNIPTTSVNTFGDNAQMGGSRDVYQGDVNQSSTIYDYSTHVGTNVQNMNVHQQTEDSASQSEEDSDEEDLEQIMENFMHSHKLRLEKICKEEDNFDKNVKISPLQLISKAWDVEVMERLEHFHLNKNIVSDFSYYSSDYVSHKHLFKEAKNAASEKFARSSTQEDISKLTQLYGNHVFISGQAGIGKSVLSRVLLREMLDPILNLNFYKSEFIFFIRFRELKYKDKFDLLEFLTMHDSFVASIPSKEKEKILRYLSECKSVYLIMDGLDEADISSKKKYRKCDIFSKATAATFLRSLFFGDLFPFAKIIVTSKPRYLARLSDNFIPSSSFLVNLLGLTDEGQQQLCCSLCSDNPVQRDKILEYLNSHPDLKRFCYVPVNAIVVMRILKETTEDQWKKLYSLTSIFVTALKMWCLQKLDNFKTEKVADMAYKAFFQDRYHFKQLHIAGTGVDIKNLMSSMVSNEFPLLSGTEIFFNFAHLVWQELLVAVKFSLFTTEDKFRNAISNLNLDKCEMITKFLFGLCNENTQTELIKHIEAKDLNTSADRMECKQLLKDLAIQKLRDVDGQGFNSVIQVSEWIYEMRDDEFTAQAAEYLNDEFSMDTCVTIYSIDVPSFNYLLRNRKTPMTLIVDNPDFFGNSFQYFIEELSFTLKINAHVQIKRLHLYYMNDDIDVAKHLSICIPKIKELSLDECAITEPGFKALVNQLRQSSETMNQLILKGVNNDIDVAMHLSLCIDKIDELELKKCTITEQGLKSLANQMRQSTKPMEKLCFEYISLDEEGVVCLSHCVDKIEHLKFDDCKLTKQGIISLASQIKNRSYPMKKLALFESYWADGWHLSSEEAEICALELLDCLHNLKELGLFCFYLQPETKTKLKACGLEVGCEVKINP